MRRPVTRRLSMRPAGCSEGLRPRWPTAPQHRLRNQGTASAGHPTHACQSPRPTPCLGPAAHPLLLQAGLIRQERFTRHTSQPVRKPLPSQSELSAGKKQPQVASNQGAGEARNLCSGHVRHHCQETPCGGRGGGGAMPLPCGARAGGGAIALAGGGPIALGPGLGSAAGRGAGPIMGPSAATSGGGGACTAAGGGAYGLTGACAQRGHGAGCAHGEGLQGFGGGGQEGFGTVLVPACRQWTSHSVSCRRTPPCQRCKHATCMSTRFSDNPPKHAARRPQRSTPAGANSRPSLYQDKLRVPGAAPP